MSCGRRNFGGMEPATHGHYVWGLEKSFLPAGRTVATGKKAIHSGMTFIFSMVPVFFSSGNSENME